MSETLEKLDQITEREVTEELSMVQNKEQLNKTRKSRCNKK